MKDQTLYQARTGKFYKIGDSGYRICREKIKEVKKRDRWVNPDKQLLVSKGSFVLVFD